jgi:methyl-CpG-binding domain protein 4
MRTPDEVSPYSFLQEELQEEPWKLLVACIMLNLTGYKQVRSVIWDFFERYPTPEILSQADEAEVASMLRSLGMQNRRARTLIRFASDWLHKDWKKITDLHGVGQYAGDSWRIFIERDCGCPVPKDKKLRMYIDWVLQSGMA